MKRMPVDQYGVVNPNDVAQAITDRTVLMRLYRQFASPRKIRPRPSIRTRADASLTTWRTF
jgi:hypothetical protein